MRSYAYFFAFIVTFLGTTPAYSTGDTLKTVPRIERIAKQMNSIFQCPERIWPGLKKDSYQIIFAEPSTKQAWLWSAKTGKTSLLDNKAFPISNNIPRYSFGQFQNAKVVILNLDVVSSKPRVSSIAVDGAVNLAFHEGFHYLFQMNEPWVAQFTSAERKKDLDHVSALYFRKMLIRSLKNALLTDQNFGQATFWFQKWEALGEAAETKFSDVLEGTANYAEIIASIIAANGCEVTEQKIIQIALASLNYLTDLPMSEEVLKVFFNEYVQSGYQIEGYEIGLLSLLALRAKGQLVGVDQYSMGRDFVGEIQSAAGNSEKMKVMTEMQSELVKVKTPCELLLRSVSPINAQDDQVLRDFIQKADLR